MTDEQIVLQSIRETIAELPPDQQKIVEMCASTLRSIVHLYGDIGKLALALVGAEAVAEIEEPT